MKHIVFIIASCLLCMFTSCQKELMPIKVTANDYQTAINKLTKTMVYDIFSPPVASRIYAYPNVAAYEIMSQKNENYTSLHSQITSLEAIPKATSKDVNLDVAAMIAYMEVGKKLVFTQDLLNAYQDSMAVVWKEINAKEFEASKSYGMQVASHIQNWIDKDNYKETRTMPKFTVDSDTASRWQPTPPSYMDGIEPHWMKIRTLVLANASQFKPKTHPVFSLAEDSDFYKELEEVYQVTTKIQETGDEAEEVKIAQFWDCNPYVAVSTGHLMTATKKITPGAHWIGITNIACAKKNYNLDDTIYANTLASITIFDAFISCWDEKYRSNLIRPETLINQHLDVHWKPLLQTPPFPEYTSGHSVVSGSAATVLTHIFGDNFSYTDDTELEYGLPSRDFTSFNQAAQEAAISRLYGGIHYRAAIDNGLAQGIHIGQFVLKTINLK
ncbi:vanadium-dependent haloperoxidase [uncultured Kordia sp.]|uniref:vanadium-dependent haloperoxidase n=1 Tax=uncultured Kordia sp. TaxID=507699 RepID=UPI002629B397|nr:vanadium-dependent haloperoxidase [uncultured Kordia sp.]